VKQECRREEEEEEVGTLGSGDGGGRGVKAADRVWDEGRDHNWRRVHAVVVRHIPEVNVLKLLIYKSPWQRG